MTQSEPTPITLAVVRRRYSRFGGAERFIERSLDGLSAIDIRPTLVCAEWDEAGDAIAPNWEVVRLGPATGFPIFDSDKHMYRCQSPAAMLNVVDRVRFAGTTNLIQLLIGVAPHSYFRGAS